MSRFVFPPWTEVFKKWLALLLLGGPVYLIALVAYGVTPEALRIGYMPEQPVPYSHQLHAGELGLDCRYCHNTVEKAALAAVPPPATCMNCHKGIFPESDKLAPVREAYAKGSELAWVRVHDLPDYVFFNHSAHVTRGVGCEECHGRIDQMREVYQAKPLTMSWCLECHWNPDSHLRDPELDPVTEMGWEPPGGDRAAYGAKVRNKYNLNPPTNCSTCHR